jgi:hypothetical protein
MALSAAIMVDLVLVTTMSLAGVSHRDENPLIPAVRDVTYVLVMVVLALGPWQGAMRSLGRRLQSVSSRRVVTLSLSFGLTLGVVSIAQQLGIDALPAAFGWGIGSKSLLFPKKEDGAAQVFDAFFPFEISYFVLAGALVDLRLVSFAGVVLGLVAAASKVVGGALGGKEGLRVGVLLSPRGAVDLVLAMALFADGTLSGNSYALAVTMITVSTLAGALMARSAFRGASAEAPSTLDRLNVTLPEPRAALQDVSAS